MTDIVLGIDLGTTNSIANVWNGTSNILIKNGDSNYFPSIINFTENGKIICENDNINSIRNIKRFIGCNCENHNTLMLINNLNHEVKIDNNQILIYNKYENKYYTIEELNSLIFNKIIKSAKQQLNNDNIKDVVITIPSHFNQIQRNSVIVSTKLSNLNCLRIINEPTAASFAYGLNYHNDENLLIFDLGGGTLDITYLNVDEGIYEIIKTTGDNFLGGEDFTQLIIQDVINQFKNTNKNYIIYDNILNEKLPLLRSLCEKFKCNNIDKIYIEDFYNDNINNINLSLNYNKSRYEINYLFNDIIHKIKDTLDLFFNDSNFSIKDINHVILVGGSTKLIEINSFIKYYFSNNNIVCNLDPDLVVSIGASIQGYIIKNPNNEFSKNIALVDILPLSIGVEMDDGIMAKILEKGVKIPVTKKKYFTNTEDNQYEVEINIYQGEREFVKDNIMISNLKLQNLKLKKKNCNIIIIEIGVDRNGMINISAFEKGTNNNKKISIKKENYNFDDEKIQKIIDESELYDKIDTYKVKFFKLKNALHSQIQNLKFNCFNNQHLKYSDDEFNKLSSHIIDIEEKYEILVKNYESKNNKNNDDYEYFISNLKKLIKVNKIKYSSLIEIYSTADNEDDGNNLNISTENYEASQQFKNILSEKNNEINNSTKVSNYSKNIISSIVKNKIFKISSDPISIDSLKDNLSDVYQNIDEILQNDEDIIQKYGDINFISNIIKSNNINFDLQKFSNINKLEKFNLLYELCTKFNITI